MKGTGCMNFNYFSILPIILGFVVVLQGSLNKQIGTQWGLSTAVLINASVFFLFSIFMYYSTKLFPNFFPDYLRAKPINENFQAWHFIPGLCGFILVLGLPWAIHKIGVAKSMTLLIGSQILMGFIWDKFIYHNEPSLLKLIGAILSLLGAILVMWG